MGFDGFDVELNTEGEPSALVGSIQKFSTERWLLQFHDGVFEGLSAEVRVVPQSAHQE